MRQARTFFEFDDAGGPLHGFLGADDYYKVGSLSSCPHHDSVLCLAPGRSLRAAVDSPSGGKPRLKPADAFVERGVGTSAARLHLPEYWAEETVVSWLRSRA